MSLGFQRGVAFPCVFRHPKRRITTLVHGDDYASSGRGPELAWLESELKKKFEIKTTVVSLESRDASEAKILNRIVRVTQKGWELEADPRHAELIIEDLGLQNSKGVVTPGDENLCKSENDAQLEGWQVQKFRSLAARANYLSADRPDIQYRVKELCRDMSAPTSVSWVKLKRVGKFLVHRPRLVWNYQWEAEANEMDGYSDSNWAGCKSTRKSTSG